MTFFRNLLGFLAVTFVLFSCKKDYSDEDGKVPGVIESTWEFKEAAQQYNGDMDSAYVQSADGFSALSMIGSRPINQSGEIILQIIGNNITTGNYSSPDIFFQYSENGTILFQTIPGQTSDFSITITQIDTASVSGTFSGTVQDPQGNSHTITDGKFSVALTKNYNPGPQPDVQLTVWAKEICFDGGPIEIKVGTQTGFISDAMLIEPECAAQGAASFTLPKGTYTVTAICGTDTLMYDVNLVTACTKLMVDFIRPPDVVDYLPLTIGSWWDYENLGSTTTKQRTIAVSDTVLDGRLYTMFISNLPDTFYYRKDDHVYYQYVTLDFNGFVQNPPSLEMVILHDDYQVNQTWETIPVDIILSGVGLKVKLVSTILRRDFSENIAGVDYDNLIDVQTEIFFSSDGGSSYQSSGSSYITTFAKGKGIVYYYDLDRAIEWGAFDVSIIP
ncbi:MAG TPA: hypothetical protein VM101_06925 [Flavitalea sp.]|nr:hypothetical protein [Flavitalea sp.]